MGAPQGPPRILPYHKRAGIRAHSAAHGRSWIRAHSNIAARLRELAAFHAVVAVLLPLGFVAIGDTAWLEIAFWACFHGGLIYSCWVAHAGQQVARRAE